MLTVNFVLHILPLKSDKKRYQPSFSLGHLSKAYYCPQVIVDGVVFHSFSHSCKTCAVTVMERG